MRRVKSRPDRPVGKKPSLGSVGTLRGRTKSRLILIDTLAFSNHEEIVEEVDKHYEDNASIYKGDHTHESDDTRGTNKDTKY
jgi:hypothetical protein